jgi:hypothetical protein
VGKSYLYMEPNGIWSVGKVSLGQFYHIRLNRVRFILMLRLPVWRWVCASLLIYLWTSLHAPGSQVPFPPFHVLWMTYVYVILPPPFLPLPLAEVTSLRGVPGMGLFPFWTSWEADWPLNKILSRSFIRLFVAKKKFCLGVADVAGEAALVEA